MAKAKLVVLADEVADTLTDKTWTLPVKAKRTYKPNTKLEDADQLTVLVAMPATRMVPDNRTEWSYEHDIDIGILYRADPNAGEATAKFDECLKLQEEIADYYREQRPTIADMPLIRVAFGAGADQPYIPEHINDLNQFTGVIRLTFREWRT
jgi:hypothetical protein